MNELDQDIPPGVDFLSEDAARKWAEEAEVKLPSRINFFATFVQAIAAHTPPVRNVIELDLPSLRSIFCRAVLRLKSTPFWTSPRTRLLSRARLEAFGSRVSFLQKVDASYDCIVTIQAVHELRQKRHAAKFYKECWRLLNESGLLLVCDHLPQDDT